MILSTCSPLWNALKSSLITFPTPVLSVYIKDKHQILSCSNPSTWQSESYSQTVNWMMSCPCSVPSLQWFSNVLKKKPYKEYFVDSSPKPNFHSFLVPPSASHSSVISSFFPCSTACSSVFYYNKSSSLTSFPSLSLFFLLNDGLHTPVAVFPPLTT